MHRSDAILRDLERTSAKDHRELFSLSFFPVEKLIDEEAEEVYESLEPLEKSLLFEIGGGGEISSPPLKYPKVDLFGSVS